MWSLPMNLLEWQKKLNKEFYQPIRIGIIYFQPQDISHFSALGRIRKNGRMEFGKA